jgi:hypothetical protein
MKQEIETADLPTQTDENFGPSNANRKAGTIVRVFVDAMKRHQVLTWGGVLARFFTVQLLVQAATAVAGIAVIRILTKTEYAWYSIATSLTFSATALTDCGVGVALLTLGGKVWQDGEALGSLITSALSIRKWLVGAVTLGAGIIVPLLLRRDGATLLPSLSITGVVILSIVLQLAIGLYGVVPKLRANYSVLQNSAIAAIAVRLCFIGFLYLCFANATTAMLANAAGFVVQIWFYQRFAAREVNLHAPARKETLAEILGIVRKQVPYELYGAISGQLGVLLISIFGNSGRVADVGAISRLAMIFTAMSGVLSNVLLPRFARCQDPTRLRPLYFRILGLYSAVVSSVLLVGWLFPNQLVSILGHNYAGLGSQCLLALGGSVAGSILVAAWGLNISRGWIVPAWIGITLGLASQVGGIVLFDIRTVHGVLLMTLTTNCIGLLFHLGASAYFFHTHERNLRHEQA